MYNYVYFDTNHDFKKALAFDVLNQNRIKFLFGLPDSSFTAVKLLHRLHFNAKLNSFVDLPLKNFWKRLYFKNTFEVKHPICFIIERHIHRYFVQVDYYSYLRQHYPDCKLIFVFRDRVKNTATPFFARDRQYLREVFDEILAYSLYDADEFEFTYFPSFESRINVLCPRKNTIDIFYAGEAKDRFRIIQDVCRKANEFELKCFFYIVGVPQEERLAIDGIVYADVWMPFSTMLEWTVQSKCILDILQGQAAGFTSRFWHAVFYNKLLISNNPIIQFTKYYNTDQMQLIHTADDINFEAIKCSDKLAQSTYSNEFSPIEFFRFLDNLLEDHIKPETFYKNWFDICAYREYLNMASGDNK